MTCIVGLVKKKTVWMGGDSQAQASWVRQTRAQPKVFRNGAYLIGNCASVRAGQLLEHRLVLPVPPKKAARLTAFMVNEFCDAVRAVWKESGHGKVENNVEEGGTFLVGVRGHLFEVYSDYQVAEVFDQYGAIGSGAEVALGSLYSTDGSILTPRERLASALAAAAHHAVGVGAPYTILSLPSSKKK